MTRADNLMAILPRILRGSFSSYKAREDFEDAVQEGLIRAWRDLNDEENERDDTYVIRRAKTWMHAALCDDSKLPTGHPGRERTGITKHASLPYKEKIRSYVDEYIALHDEKPTQAQISQATGIHKDTISRHMRNLNAGDHALYRDDTTADGGIARRRVDRRAYISAPLLIDGADGNTFMHPDAEALSDGYQFEDVVASEDSFSHMLATLTDEDRKVITMYFQYGMTHKEIGNVLGFTYTSQSRRRLLRGLDQIKEDRFGIAEKNPEAASTGEVQSHCKRGHELKAHGRGKGCNICRAAAARRRRKEKRAA